jgi:hypothetical protein
MSARTTSRVMCWGVAGRIEVSKHTEMGWGWECRPAPHDLTCYRKWGCQDLSEALREAQDHKRKHVVRAVA